MFDLLNVERYHLISPATLNIWLNFFKFIFRYYVLNMYVMYVSSQSIPIYT